MRQYPLQALRRPYRRLPCRWRRDAAPGRTRHCPSLHLASQREDAPAPAAGPTFPYCRAHGWTGRQDYGKRRPAGPPLAFHRPRRRNGGPGFGREPRRKKVNTQALQLDRQKWPLQGEGHSISAAFLLQTGLANACTFSGYFAPYLPLVVIVRGIT